MPDPDDMEDDPLPLPEFLDKYMVTGRLAKWIVSSKIFEAVILLLCIIPSNIEQQDDALHYRPMSCWPAALRGGQN